MDKKGNIWFSEANANQVATFIPEARAFHEYKIPTDFANPGELTVDSDGKVWFVELTANRIGVFYPDWGRFDEALIPTPQGMPSAIEADKNGNLWFLEYRGNKVGKFNPADATFREYDIPSFNSQPGALAIDHNRGIVWFSETSTEVRKLGRLSIKEAVAQNREDDKSSTHPSEDSPAKEGAAATSYMAFVFLMFAVAAAVAWLRYVRKGSSKG
ncbi:MAG: hypothetical protein GWN86_10165 [Desulfobacterales bacterium]|nr:hypothetical protein [Desulfobacterales bacterium]